jgi:hypothetical protein
MFFSISAIKKGEEIFISYIKEADNNRLLAQYGFHTPGNFKIFPSTETDTSDPSQAPSAFEDEVKTEFVKELMIHFDTLEHESPDMERQRRSAVAELMTLTEALRIKEPTDLRIALLEVSTALLDRIEGLLQPLQQYPVDLKTIRNGIQLLVALVTHRDQIEALTRSILESANAQSEFALGPLLADAMTELGIEVDLMELRGSVSSADGLWVNTAQFMSLLRFKLDYKFAILDLRERVMCTLNSKLTVSLRTSPSQR